MKKISKICLAILICFTFAILNISEVGAYPSTPGTGGNAPSAPKTGGSINGSAPGNLGNNINKNNSTSADIYDAPSHNQNSGSNGVNGAGLGQAPATQTPSSSESTSQDGGDKDISKIKEWGETDGTGETTPNVGDCSVIGGETKNFLNKIFSYISIIGIIIVVIMSILDGIKVITASEDGAMGNFLKGLRVRIICLVLLLILPMLVTFVVSTINNVANIAGVNSNDPLCGVTK